MLSRNNYQEKIHKMENKKNTTRFFGQYFFMKREISNKGSML